MATKKKKSEKTKTAVLPMTVLLGWLETDSAKDAKAYARGVVKERIIGQEESWFGVLPFHGGFLWEAHQGGDGHGYIKSIAHAVEQDPGGEYWFRVGDRAYRIIMQDGKPFPHLLPSDKSVEIINTGTPQLERNYSLTPYMKKGTKVLAMGIVMSGAAALFFLGSVAFYGFAYNPGPSVRAVDVASMPHMKWPLVESIGVEEIVAKLLMKNSGEWSVNRRAHVVEGLDKLRKQRLDLEKANLAQALAEDAELVQVPQAAVQPSPDLDVREIAPAGDAVLPIDGDPTLNDSIPVPTPVQGWPTSVPAPVAPTMGEPE